VEDLAYLILGAVAPPAQDLEIPHLPRKHPRSQLRRQGQILEPSLVLLPAHLWDPLPQHKQELDPRADHLRGQQHLV